MFGLTGTHLFRHSAERPTSGVTSCDIPGVNLGFRSVSPESHVYLGYGGEGNQPGNQTET